MLSRSTLHLRKKIREKKNRIRESKRAREKTTNNRKKTLTEKKTGLTCKRNANNARAALIYVNYVAYRACYTTQFEVLHKLLIS